MAAILSFQPQQPVVRGPGRLEHENTAAIERVVRAQIGEPAPLGATSRKAVVNMHEHVLPPIAGPIISLFEQALMDHLHH
jgi:hypothetical protein